MSRLLSRVQARSLELKNKLKMPDRFKGTVVENWARYWKGLLKDYREVVVDTAQSMRDRPGKAAVYLGLLSGVFASIKRNPHETAYRSHVIQARDEIGLVNESVRNPTSHQYLVQLEKLFNEDRIRHVSLGVASIYWIADLSSDVAVPRATTSYLEPAIVNWHHRIVDIAFWGRFWKLEEKIKDFDVNPKEWES